MVPHLTMSTADQEPTTDVTVRHTRKRASDEDEGLAAELARQKRVLFELFERDADRTEIEQARDHLRRLQLLQSNVEAKRAQARAKRMEEAGTGRRRKFAAASGSEVARLDKQIEMQRRLLKQMFDEGQDQGPAREKLKRERDKLHRLERQRERMAATVVEATDRIERLAEQRPPSRLLRLLANLTPFVLLTVLIPNVDYAPLRLTGPWWGLLILVAAPYLLVWFAWRKIAHFRVMGVLFPLAMIVVNAICYWLGILGKPDWSLAVGLCMWIFIGVALVVCAVINAT